MLAVVAGAGLVTPLAPARADTHHLDRGLPQPRRVELAFAISVRPLGDRDLLGRRLDGLVRGDTPAQQGARDATVGEAGGEVVALGVRSSAELARGVYAGVEVSGGGARDQRAFESRVLHYSAGGVLSVALLEGALVARADLLVGVRGTATRRSQRRRNEHPWATDAHLMIEPRVALEVPLGPDRYRVGVHVGTDLVRHREVAVGVHLTVHGHASDGFRLARSAP